MSEEKAKLEGVVDGVHKMAWLIIQSTNSVNGEEPNDTEWVSLLPEDIPEWVKQDDVISNLAKGQRVCMRPDQGGRWYRALIVNNESIH